jgi:hypothetical protein
MEALQRQSQPAMTKPPNWHWICELKEAEVQVSTYVHKTMFTDLYDVEYSDYWPTSNERLEDWAVNNRLVRGMVFLIFLVWKSYRMSKRDPIVISKVFAAPQTSVYSKPRKYNKLEYRIDTLELRMEFYLRVLEMLCKPGDNMFSVFGSGKVLCAGVVSIPTISLNLIS